MKHSLLIVLASIFLSGTGSAADLGKFGRTWPVIEPDGIEEMKQAAGRVDWSRYFNKSAMEKAIHDYKPRGFISLPKASRDRVRQVDISYSVEFDVIDPSSGEVLYPRGYTFNPLDYITLHKKIVVLDGSDQEQVEWFNKSGYAKDPMTVLLITGGVFYEVGEKVKRSVFFATDKIIRRLQVEHVPSVAYQNQRMIEVVEIDVSKNSKD